MKEKLIILLGGLLFGGFLMYLLNDKEIEYVKVPVTIEVEVPVIEKEFDTVYIPSETKKSKPQIDSIYYKEYVKLKDSFSKNEAYKEAITIREYNPIFEDEFIKIFNYNKVRGDLLETQTTYKTKPRTIIVDTTLTIEVPRRAKLYVGGTIYLPTSETSLEGPGIGPTMMILNKKQSKIINFGYDIPNKTLTTGIVFKL